MDLMVEQPVDEAAMNTEAARRAAAAEPRSSLTEVKEDHAKAQREAHTRKFPLGENLFRLIFLVLADLPDNAR